MLAPGDQCFVCGQVFESRNSAYKHVVDSFRSALLMLMILVRLLIKEEEEEERELRIRGSQDEKKENNSRAGEG